MPSRSSLAIPLDTPPLPLTPRALSPPSQFRPLPFMLTTHPLRTGSPGLAPTSQHRHHNWPRIPQNLQRRELFPLSLLVDLDAERQLPGPSAFDLDFSSLHLSRSRTFPHGLAGCSTPLHQLDMSCDPYLRPATRNNAYSFFGDSSLAITPSR